MKTTQVKNILTIDCDDVINKIKQKYGETPIFSSKYEKVKKSLINIEN